MTGEDQTPKVFHLPDLVNVVVHRLLAHEGASYDEGVIDGVAMHHHTVELLDPICGEARSEVVAREVEVDEAGEVGEAGRHEHVEAVPGEVEVAKRGEGANARGRRAVAVGRQSR